MRLGTAGADHQHHSVCHVPSSLTAINER
jgi:hypothetical protein